MFIPPTYPTMMDKLMYDMKNVPEICRPIISSIIQTHTGFDGNIKVDNNNRTIRLHGTMQMIGYQIQLMCELKFDDDVDIDFRMNNETFMYVEVHPKKHTYEKLVMNEILDKYHIRHDYINYVFAGLQLGQFREVAA
jgi:hypothetical protein